MSLAAVKPQTMNPARSGEWAAFVWSSVPGVFLVIAVATGWIPERLGLAVFAVSYIGLNLMHMGATWARVYVRPGWRASPLERLTVPALLVLFALSFEAIGGGAVLLAAQYLLSFHHALMQNYGLLRTSQRRSGRVVDHRLDMAACLMLPGAALLYRTSVVCGHFYGAPLPGLPIGLIALVALAGGIALAAFAWREWQSHRRGEEVDPIGAGLLFGTNLMWSGMLVADPHPLMPLYALASGHYVQYLYFVRRAELRDPINAETSLTRQFQSGLRTSPLRYLVLLLIFAGAVTWLLTFASMGLRAAAVSMEWRPDSALALPPWVAAMIGVNFEHYWLDHRIWRVRPRKPAVLPAYRPA